MLCRHYKENGKNNFTLTDVYFILYTQLQTVVSFCLVCYKHNQTGLICWHSQALCRVNMNFRLPLKLLYL